MKKSVSADKDAVHSIDFSLFEVHSLLMNLISIDIDLLIDEFIEPPILYDCHWIWFLYNVYLQVVDAFLWWLRLCYQGIFTVSASNCQLVLTSCDTSGLCIGESCDTSGLCIADRIFFPINTGSHWTLLVSASVITCPTKSICGWLPGRF